MTKSESINIMKVLLLIIIYFLCVWLCTGPPYASPHLTLKVSLKYL